MSEQAATGQQALATLGEALADYLETLKPEARVRKETYVRKYVDYAGHETVISSITGSHVELFREAHIVSTDPAATERVQALKEWFQFLKKKNYTDQNFGVYVRVKKTSLRSINGATATSIEQESIQMTQEGLDALQSEYEDLASKRPDLIKAIQEAREDKDFRENSPLEAAREALAFAEQRLRELENSLKRAVIADSGAADVASIGSVVTVTRLDRDESMNWKLVGAREANAREQKISVESPVGKALLGARTGDIVTVEAPSGLLEFRLDSIQPS